jgi:hypothetical protein
LSLGLGTVYLRTGSLIAAIVMHATFNGLSTVALIGALLAGQARDLNERKANTSTERDGPVAVGKLFGK